MNEKNEINRSYEILDGDDDVLLLGKATFTVRRFKELAASKFSEIIDISTNARLDSTIPRMMFALKINEETSIWAEEINWSANPKGIPCQILEIGAKGWPKGKLKIEVNRSFRSRETQTSLKFCPDEPLDPKSPLDDIRQSEEYKKLSNNN